MSGDETAPQTPASLPPPVVLTPAAVKRVHLLLLVFSLLFAIWIAAMIAMYVTTVYPERHPAAAPTAAAPK